MDERLRFALWILGGAGFFGLLGALFGGVVGAVTWRDGRAAGGFLGMAVADAFDRVREHPLSPTARGTLVGVVDGAFFLAVLGAAAGAVAGRQIDLAPQVVVAVCSGAVLLVLAAIVFGLLASNLVRAGVWVVGGVCAAALVGAVLGGRIGGSDGILLGMSIGALLGFLFGLLTGTTGGRDRIRPPDEKHDGEPG